MSDKLIIPKKLPGDDGYRVFSVRVKTKTLHRIDALTKETQRTRNELIGLLLDFALDHSEVSHEPEA